MSRVITWRLIQISKGKFCVIDLAMRFQLTQAEIFKTVPDWELV